jgi:hypothetical protein
VKQRVCVAEAAAEGRCIGAFNHRWVSSIYASRARLPSGPTRRLLTASEAVRRTRRIRHATRCPPPPRFDAGEGESKTRTRTSGGAGDEKRECELSAMVSAQSCRKTGGVQEDWRTLTRDDLAQPALRYRLAHAGAKCHAPNRSALIRLAAVHGHQRQSVFKGTIREGQDCAWKAAC